MKLPAFWKTREFGAFVVLLLMLVACEVGSRTHSGQPFLTAKNLAQVAADFSLIGIAAIGAAIVIISGGVDLSSGSIMCLSSVILALAAKGAVPAPLALAAAFGVGMATGLVNGLLVGQVRLPPFIATLGMMSVARGLAYWVSGGHPLSPDAESSAWFGLLGKRSEWVMLALAVAAAVVMARFSWGRHVYAIGGNEEAARFAGLRVARIKTGIYVQAGFFSAVAGCAYALSYGSANVAVAEGYELQIIAACAIGGVSFSGGQGSVAGAVIGAAILQVLRELFTRFNTPDKYTQMAYGAMIILSVAVDQLRDRGVLAKWFGRRKA